MKFYTLQLYRFIAAVLVMFHHLDITRSGNNGVYIFFVISGFVIYLKLFSPDQPPPFRFFTNRLTKIFFLYWLALIFMYIVRPFPINRSIVKTILLVPDHISWLRVSWTLSYELYFYFLTGLVVYLLPNKYAKAFLLLLLSISTIITILYPGGYMQIKDSSLNFLLGKNTWNFFLGLLSGYLTNIMYKSVKIHVVIPIFILVYILFSAAFIYPSDSFVSALITGVVSFLLISFSAAYEKESPCQPKRPGFSGCWEMHPMPYIYSPLLLEQLFPAEIYLTKSQLFC